MTSSHAEKTALSVTPDEVAQARKFWSDMERAHGVAMIDAVDSVILELRDGDSVAIPPQLGNLVSQMIDLLSRGCTVTIGCIPHEVTTTMAAKMLGTSRPTLMKLIADGELSSHKVGSHTRMFSNDVMAYRDSRLAGQREAFEELRRLEDELGLDD